MARFKGVTGVGVLLALLSQCAAIRIATEVPSIPSVLPAKQNEVSILEEEVQKNKRGSVCLAEAYNKYVPTTGGCGALDEESKSWFALEIASCKLELLGRPRITSCNSSSAKTSTTEEENNTSPSSSSSSSTTPFRTPLQDCGATLTAEQLNIYVTFNAHIDNLCYFSESRRWREYADRTTNKLLNTTTLALEDAANMRTQLQLLSSETQSSYTLVASALTQVASYSQAILWTNAKLLTNWFFLQSIGFYCLSLYVVWAITAQPQAKESRSFVVFAMVVAACIEYWILSYAATTGGGNFMTANEVATGIVLPPAQLQDAPSMLLGETSSSSNGGVGDANASSSNAAFSTTNDTTHWSLFSLLLSWILYPFLSLLWTCLCFILSPLVNFITWGVGCILDAALGGVSTRFLAPMRRTLDYVDFTRWELERTLWTIRYVYLTVSGIAIANAWIKYVDYGRLNYDMLMRLRAENATLLESVRGEVKKMAAIKVSASPAPPNFGAPSSASSSSSARGREGGGGGGEKSGHSTRSTSEDTDTAGASSSTDAAYEQQEQYLRRSSTSWGVFGRVMAAMLKRVRGAGGGGGGGEGGARVGTHEEEDNIPSSSSFSSRLMLTSPSTSGVRPRAGSSGPSTPLIRRLAASNTIFAPTGGSGVTTLLDVPSSLTSGLHPGQFNDDDDEDDDDDDYDPSNPDDIIHPINAAAGISSDERGRRERGSRSRSGSRAPPPPPVRGAGTGLVVITTTKKRTYSLRTRDPLTGLPASAIPPAIQVPTNNSNNSNNNSEWVHMNPMVAYETPQQFGLTVALRESASAAAASIMTSLARWSGSSSSRNGSSSGSSATDVLEKEDAEDYGILDTADKEFVDEWSEDDDDDDDDDEDEEKDGSGEDDDDDDDTDDREDIDRSRRWNSLHYYNQQHQGGSNHDADAGGHGNINNNNDDDDDTGSLLYIDEDTGTFTTATGGRSGGKSKRADAAVAAPSTATKPTTTTKETAKKRGTGTGAKRGPNGGVGRKKGIDLDAASIAEEREEVEEEEAAAAEGRKKRAATTSTRKTGVKQTASVARNKTHAVSASSPILLT